MTDISRLSYRMSKQLDMALNDLKHVRENIDEINKIVYRESNNNSERKIETYEEKHQQSEDNPNLEEKKIEENEIVAAGFVGEQHNMTHNRWISSLRSPFGLSFY